MPFEIKLALFATLVVVSVVAGLIWRARTGRANLVKSGELVDLGKLEATKNGARVSKYGRKVTFVQFSTEVCSQCRQTARLLGEVEAKHKDVLHIEVDVSNRLDLAAHFKVLQTPTTLVLDSTGRVKSRIGGAPKPNVITHELEKLEVI
jgi:thiol-disulfide isomerase/thioredoxin